MSELLHRTLPEQIADRLRQDILAGKLRPNQPLREQEISDRFGVSRGPIREVFRQLTQQGLLVTEPNKGVRVADQPSDQVRSLIVDLRLKIELFVLEHVFEQLKGETLDRLEDRLETIHSACQAADTGALAEADLAFHQAIINAYGDQDLVTLWQPVVLRMMIDYQRHTDLMESYHEHKRILDAVKAGDKPGALAALRANIQ